MPIGVTLNGQRYSEVYAEPQTDQAVPASDGEVAAATSAIEGDAEASETTRSPDDAAVLARAEEANAPTGAVATVDFAFEDLAPPTDESVAEVPEELRSSPSASRAYLSTRGLTNQIQNANRSLESVKVRLDEVQRQRNAVQAVITEFRQKRVKANKALDLETLMIRDSNGQEKSAAALLSSVGLLDRFVSGGKAEATIESLESMSQELSGASDSINSGTQMAMIQLQELMKQKDFMIELVSNELASRNQLRSKILENLR